MHLHAWLLYLFNHPLLEPKRNRLTAKNGSMLAFLYHNICEIDMEYDFKMTIQWILNISEKDTTSTTTNSTELLIADLYFSS